MRECLCGGVSQISLDVAEASNSRHAFAADLGNCHVTHTTDVAARMPLVVWTLVAGVLFAGAMLVLMDIVQSSAVRQVAQSEFAKRLSEAALTDRQRFDEVMRGHKNLVRILAEQDGLRVHALREFNRADKRPHIAEFANRSAGLPPWLASRTLFHALPIPDFVVLVDPNGLTRVVYRHRDLLAPKELIELSARDRAVTQGQTLLKNLDGVPYVLSSWPIRRAEQVLGDLLVASRIDDYFLIQKLRLALEPASVMALLTGGSTGGDPIRVVASSVPARIPDGSELTDLKEKYFVAGDQFPHYGVAEIPVRFATLVPKERLRELVDPIVESERRHRILLSAILIAFFLLLLAYLSLRIRRLSSAVAVFSTEALGVPPANPRGMDELARLKWRFEHLTEEVVGARDALLKEATERMRLTSEQLAMKAENERLRLLQAVTETMGVGVLKGSEDGPVALNATMRGFASLCGGMRPFTSCGRVTHDVEIRDVHGRDRIFLVTRTTELGPDLLLVEDVTEQRRAEQEIQLAAITFESHDGIFICSANRLVLRVNKAFTRITGYEPSEVLGRRPDFCGSDQPDTNSAVTIADEMREKGQWQGEAWSHRRSGERYPVWLTLTAVRNRLGETTHYVGVIVDLTELKLQRSTIERKAAEEAVLGNLLRLSHQPTELEEFLKKALVELLGSVPWLKLEPKGAVFLCGEDDANALHLSVSLNLDPTLATLCERVPIGNCLCGRAALTREIQFATCIDERHETQYPDMPPHGHYSVPILSGESVLGVVVLYVREGHQRMTYEESFLRRIADVLSMAIMSRHADAILEHQAYHDVLTGLPNRRALLDRLQHEVDAAARGNFHGAVLFLDLDNFKTLNDSMGHPSGDALLGQVASRLTRELRAADTVARLGGDEFVVLLSQLNGDVDRASFEAQGVAEKIRAALAKPYDIDGHAYHSTPSIGVVLFPTGGESADDILKHADTAMYRAKAEGRDTTRFYLPSMQAAADARLALEKDLRLGLSRGEFRLRYQPHVLVASGQVAGAEALLRWQHPERGLLAPDAFINLAEETGIVSSLGEWVLYTAIKQIREWRDAQPQVALDVISVNTSPRQFQQSNVVDVVTRILRDTGVSGSRLILEITESVMMSDIEDVIEKMRALRRLQVRFSIDDFGTGYSSLNYLKRLPISQLKIDRCFVEDLPGSRSDMSIVDTIISTAHHLGLEVLAEGVENAAQLEVLRARGCGMYQGYHFSGPLTAADFARLQHFGQRRMVGEKPSTIQFDGRNDS